jgi:catechol 2,3-dioxygenase-like lactoylglutathione lyase family enzyme
MAKIRHVAMQVTDAALLRDFYAKGFGFEQCYGPSASGSIMVMDGLFNLALLQMRQSESEIVGTHRADGGEAVQVRGINHYGFVVDNIAESVERVGSELEHGENPPDGRPAEMRVIDTWGNAFDLSSRGYFGREEVKLPAIRKVVIQTDHPGDLAEFYTSKLDLTEESRDADESVTLCDGLIHMALVREGLTDKKGIQYVGIQIDDWRATADRFEAMGETLEIPEDRDAEAIIHDPEGNLLVLSTRGWDP